LTAATCQDSSVAIGTALKNSRAIFMNSKVSWLSKLIIWGSLVSSVGCGLSGANSDTLRIGVLYSLSGDQSSLDRSSLNGVELAAKELNAQGGVLGKSITLEVRDARSSVEVVAKKAVELYDDEGLSILIGLSDTDLANPVALHSESSGKIFVTSGATGPALVTEAPHSTFLACFSDISQAQAAARFSSDSLRLASVTIVSDATSEYAKTLTKTFLTEFKKSGSVAKEVYFPGASLDVASIVESVKAGRGEGVFLAGQPDEVSAIIQALRSSGMRSPIIGGDSYDSPLIANLKVHDKDQIYYTTHALLTTSASTEESSHFIDRYTQEYGEAPGTAFAALGYDTMNLVMNAVRDGGSTEPSHVRTALESIREFPGVTGRISYGKSQHIPKKDVSIVTFREGKAVLADIIPNKSAS
jgi:branched-chain amino acid transport system substrate-binding protein